MFLGFGGSVLGSHCTGKGRCDIGHVGMATVTGKQDLFRVDTQFHSGGVIADALSAPQLRRMMEALAEEAVRKDMGPTQEISKVDEHVRKRNEGSKSFVDYRMESRLFHWLREVRPFGS